MAIRSPNQVFGSSQLCLAAVLALALAPARADIVVDHPRHPYGGPGSDTDFLYFGTPAWQLIADDFSLTQGAEIGSIRWLGFYGSTFDDYPEPAPVSEVMRIRFMGARPSDGLPDESNIVYEETFLNTSRIATGHIIATGPAPPEYEYFANLSRPATLNAATPYWLEIAQIDDIDSHFRWETSIAGNDFLAVANPFVPNWMLDNGGDLAFQLLGVPEPASIAMLFFVPFTAGRIEAERRRRHRTKSTS